MNRSAWLCFFLTSTPYERFYVVLVEANTVVIPEEILYKRLQAFLFGSN
jgi:hypothetical protein